MFIMSLIDHIIYLLLTMQIIFRDYFNNKKKLKRCLNDIKCKYSKWLKLDHVDISEITLFCISVFGDKPQFENFVQEELAMLTLPWTTQSTFFPQNFNSIWQGEEDDEEYSSWSDLAEIGEKYTWKRSGYLLLFKFRNRMLDNVGLCEALSCKQDVLVPGWCKVWIIT